MPACRRRVPGACRRVHGPVPPCMVAHLLAPEAPPRVLRRASDTLAWLPMGETLVAPSAALAWPARESREEKD